MVVDIYNTERKYNIIYADPPWEYSAWSKKAQKHVTKHSVIFSPIEKHSKKPEQARDGIEKLFGDLPRIELFARQQADEWDCWGNEVE